MTGDTCQYCGKPYEDAVYCSVECFRASDDWGPALLEALKMTFVEDSSKRASGETE